MKNKISVVICTRKRHRLLKKCLNSLCRQTISPENFEVVVVDNEVNAKVEKIVKEYKEKLPNTRYEKSEKVGIAPTRNVGYKAAKHKWIAYIDDDAYAENDWVENILKFIHRHPEAKIFGGPYARYSEVAIPDWFPEEFGNKNLGNKIKILHPPKHWLSIGNMIVKKKLLESVGGFDESLGMSGKKIGYGEEDKFQIQVQKRGVDIYYVPKVRIKHIVRKEKMYLNWLLKNSYAHGLYSHRSKNIKHTLRSHGGVIIRVVGMFFYWSFSPKKIPIKRRIYYALRPILSEIGALVSIIR